MGDPTSNATATAEEKDSAAVEPAVPGNAKTQAPVSGIDEAYLTQMRLDSLFEELVEELLVDTPDNPVKYMIDYLFAQFPDQARESSFANTFPTSANFVGGGIPLTGLTALSIGHDADELENEEEDGPVPDVTLPFQQTQGREANLPPRRRGAVCARTITEDSASTSLPALKDSTPEDGPTPGELQILCDALEKDFYFSQLNANERRAVQSGFRIMNLSQDETACRQGETSTQFFVVAAGECKQELRDEHILTLKAATCFGHANLLHAAKAVTTVTVTSEKARVFSIDAERFRSLLHSFRKSTRSESHAAVLRKVPVFGTSVLSDVEVGRLAADVATVENFSVGDILVRQHAPSDTMYVILDGTARCEQRLSASDRGQLVTCFGAGDWFGEIALITDRPRAASVIAETAITALAIARDRFTRVFGPLTEVLCRDEVLFRRFVSDKL
ncbi:cAMP-dependent protein kinase regulatory subunit [Hondaea fermentalgiana]|uniref:cAMP-dependent protein kinase regulatory subunit n=1 Tax=Hondaea fermentalgiana TaxID=2315210 RepID=A0A2R5GPX6_9STRA|nr:cAMP-dependent protein kinase regulatory subunit [Hondaea fermentalgiana]|eukprot:GBG30401.1 cAMP-dependent protein kinase regulatory subunit [Hondaea fermentalgiana]